MGTLERGANPAAREALIRHRTQARVLDLRQRGPGNASGVTRSGETQASQTATRISEINPAPLPDSQHPVTESGSPALGEVAIDPTANPDWPFGPGNI